MTPEEYQRFKEAEKEHLRSLRELKKAVHGLSRQKRLADAVENAVQKPMDALDDHDALVQELALETARNEAKLDVALESVDLEQKSLSPTTQPSPADEAVLRKARAAHLVEQLKAQMGAATATARREAPGEERATGTAASQTSAGSRDDNESKSAKRHTEPTGQDQRTGQDQPTAEDLPLPEKTIGRMKPS